MMRRYEISIDIGTHLSGFGNHAGWCISVHNNWISLMDFFDRAAHHFGKLGNNRPYNHFINFLNINFVSLIEHQKLNKKLIRCFVRFRIDNPRKIAVIIIKETEADIGISYIDYDGIHFLILSEVGRPMSEVLIIVF